MTITWSHGDDGVPTAISSVATSSAARVLANPDRLARVEIEGYAYGAREFGFTLAELLVLNRYRRRTLP